MGLERLKSKSWAELMSQVDTFLLDCDGVLWTGDKPIEGSADAIAYLRKQGKQVILLTNNSTKSRSQYVEKCQRLGFKDITSTDNVITTSAVCADYLKNVHPVSGRVYMIGSIGVKKELDDKDIPNIGFGPDPVTDHVSDDQVMVNSVPLEENISAVVVGFDKHISYPKLMKAITYLKDPKVHFVATNLDETMPGADPTIVIPGTGAIVAPVVEGSRRKPDAVMGKPSPVLFGYIKRHFNVDPFRTVMVGDRCNTDIQFGRIFGLKTLFVQSGDQQLSEVQAYANSKDPAHEHLVPDYYVSRLGAVLDLKD